MGKRGINPDEWNEIVQKAQITASEITDPEKIIFSKTTLTVFKNLETKQETLKNMIAKYKTIVNNETNKMILAGENIVVEDEHAAKNIQENTGKAKFK